MSGPELPMTRRALLAAIGAAALVPIAGCSAPAPAPAPSSGSPTPSPSASPSSSPAPAPVPGAPATEVVNGSRTVPAVALTFHGQGDPALAERILLTAEQAGAAVTVMAVGNWLKQYPRVGDRVLSGHELGNHTMHHLPMRTMSESEAFDEITAGLEQVRRYVTAPTWFRPSGTPRATPAILAAAGRAGYASSLSFDVDPADYTDPGAAAVASRVLAAVQPGSIVSLHLGHAGTADALPAILSGLQRKQLRPVTVSELLQGIAP